MVFDEQRSFFSSNKINDLNFFSGFGTKITNHSQIINSFSPLSAWQTHSTNIKFATQPETNIKDVDGLITKTKGLLLMVKTADCVPIIFADRKNKIIGISHQGWKGTLDQLAVKMVFEMQKHGAQIEHLFAAVGPAICKKCYAVSPDLYAKFSQKFSLKEKDNYLDLKQINYQQLLSTGLKPEQIEVSRNCTYCEKELFYSCRRDGKKSPARMISFIAMRS